jgi:3D (Asp-Asp-Asp) domain-containing protein
MLKYDYKLFFGVFLIFTAIFYFNFSEPSKTTSIKKSVIYKKISNIGKNGEEKYLLEYYKKRKDGESIIYADLKVEKSEKYEVYKNFLSTAYYPGPESCGQYADGYTSNLMIADYGIIAVDPNVIPLGSVVYVENYGFAIAADVGGKIKGRRIDVCFPDIESAKKYGVKRVDIVRIK